MEEELARVFVGPVFGELEALFGVLLDGFDDFFEGFVFADEFEGCCGADFGDGVEVVAAEENAKVDKLVKS